MDDMTSLKQENRNQKQGKPKLFVNLENNIKRLKTEIAHVQVIINCKNKEKFMKHQNIILHRLKKKFGDTKMKTLETKLALLKQDQKSKSKQLKYKKDCQKEKRNDN